MRILLVAFTFILALAFVTSGQTVKGQGLVLNGSVYSVTPRINPNGNKPLFLYEVRFYLQLRNDSNVPLIVFKPTDDLLARRVEFLDGFDDERPGSDGAIRASPWIVPFEESFAARYARDKRFVNYNPHYAMGQQINFPSPPLHNTSRLLLLEPGSYFEFYETMTLEDGFGLEIKPRQGLHEIVTNLPKAVDPALRVAYKLSLKKHYPDDDLLKKLQDRWRKVGHLILDSNGDFAITSNPVVTGSGN